MAGFDDTFDDEFEEMSDQELQDYDAQHPVDDGEGAGEPVPDPRAYRDGYVQSQVDSELDSLEERYPELQGNEELQELVVRDALEAARRQGGVPQSEVPRLIEQATLARRDPGDSIVNSMASGRFRLGE